MPTGPEHYQAAERHIAEAKNLAGSSFGMPIARTTALLDAAQVHATLALAAATALGDTEDGMPIADYEAWRKAAATPTGSSDA